MPRSLFLPLSIVVILMTVTIPARAQTPPLETPATAPVVGTLLEIEGPVSLLTPGAEPIPLSLNAPVHMNDVIETGAGARAFIALIDNTELTLGENAQLTIDEYVFDEENEAINKGRYSVLRGAFLYTSGLVAKKENPDVTVKTPYGAIGIRGTTFWGGDIDGEYGILVTEGSVSVQTDRGRINVDKGHGTSLRSKTSIPVRAGVWGEEKIGRAVQTIALKNASKMPERVTHHAEAQKHDRVKYKEYLQQRLIQKQLQNDTRVPSTRIDNLPRPAERKEIVPPVRAQQPVTEVKPETKKPAVLDDAAPTEKPMTVPVDPNLNKPFKDETRKIQDGRVEPLLKAAPTNTAPLPTTAPSTTPALDKQLEKLKEEVKDKGADATQPGAPKVDLPVMGNSDAHSNEMREQQHLQRRQPVVRRTAPASTGRSKAADAF